MVMVAATAAPAFAADVYKGKGNGYGWIKNNAGVFPVVATTSAPPATRFRN